jgi:hypothetical protein
MAKFQMTPTVYSEKVITARLGGNALATRMNDLDVGKPVKLSGDSCYVLCSAADAIEGIVTSVETGLYDGYVLGGVVRSGMHYAVADGSQADGTGAIAVGDYVLAAAPEAVQVAKAAAHLKVRKATTQATAADGPYKARVVSLGPVGTGAVGTVIVIELF